MTLTALYFIVAALCAIYLLGALRPSGWWIIATLIVCAGWPLALVLGVVALLYAERIRSSSSWRERLGWWFLANLRRIGIALAVLAIAGVTLLLSSCASTSAPRPRVALKPAETAVVTKAVYVRVDAALTEPHPIAEGPLSACPEIAAQRRAELLHCNAKLEQIRNLEGTEAK